LERAREKRDDARRALADGIDPKREASRGVRRQNQHVFAVAGEWLLTKKASRNAYEDGQIFADG
jgi:hypothetical protein